MSNLSGYPTRSFKESQKFLVQDPSTGTASLVLGSDLVDYITPQLNAVNAESTRLAAENTDYDVGQVIQTTGATSPGDNFAAVYLVVEGGAGDFPMLNGNDLLVIRGDEFLREQLISEDAGEGASLVSMEGGPTVEEAMFERVISVSSVSELKAYDVDAGTQFSLDSGGKSGSFVVKSGSPPTDPEEGVNIVMTNGNYAMRRYDAVTGNGGVNIEWFGAVGDDVADDRDAIQAAIDYVSDNLRAGVVFVPTPSVAWRIESTLNLPVFVEMHGPVRGGDGGVQFRMRTGAYTNNFGILVNTTDLSDWLVAFPGLKMPTIKNIDFSTDDNTLYAIGFNGSLIVDSCRFQFFASSVRGGTRYNDEVRIFNCEMAASIQPATYQIDLGNTGDSVVIQQCSFPNVGNDPKTPLKSIKISGNNGFAIRDCLMGDIFIDTCTASSSIINSGTDGGRWLIADSNVSLRDCALSARETDTCLVFDRTNTFGYQATLSNVTITHDVERDAYDPYEFDVSSDPGYIVKMENVSKRIIVGTSPQSRRLQGIKFETVGGSPIDDFNKYSYMYSTNSIIRGLFLAGNPFNLEVPGTTISVLSSVGLFSPGTWDGATDTYFYKAVVYYDVDRAVARTDSASEVSISLTNGGDAAALDVQEGTYPPNKIIRVYRGTSTGSYDSYADVHVISTPSLIDNGPQISGVPWVSRTAGPIDAFNNYSLTGFGIEDGLAKFVGPAAPVEGTWLLGDLTRDKAPAASGFIGWVCVAAGTPGTWKTYGAISA